MSIKLALLKSGEEIIADIKEGVVEDKVVTYIFNDPHSVVLQGTYKIVSDDEETFDRVSLSLIPWPRLSSDKVVPVRFDWVVTIVEPNLNLKKMYETQVLNDGKENNQVANFTEQSNSNNSN